MLKTRSLKKPQIIVATLHVQSESWRSIVKGLLPFATILLISFTRMRLFGQEIQNLGYTVYFGESLFTALNDGINMVAVPLMVLLMVSELPKRFSFQYMTLTRSNRKAWLGSQILYCLVVSMAMFLMMTLCISLTSLGFVSPGSGWSDFARIETGGMSEWNAIVGTYIREHYTPLTANLLAMPPVILYLLTLLNIVLLCNLLNKPMLGIAVYLMILWTDAIFNAAYIPWLPIPQNYASLSGINIADHGMGYYWKVLLGYVVMNTALYATMLLRMRRSDLTFLTKPSE